MSAKGVSMHKVREILRLHFESQFSQRQIASSLHLSPGVINKYLKLDLDLRTMPTIQKKTADTTNDDGRLKSSVVVRANSRCFR